MEKFIIKCKNCSSQKIDIRVRLILRGNKTVGETITLICKACDKKEEV